SFDPSLTGTIYLEDKKTGTIHDFSVSDTYSFTALTSDAADRFVLHYGSFTPDDDLSNAAVYVSQGYLVVDLQALNDNYQLNVFDLSGRMVYTNQLSGGEKKTVSLPAKGIYIVSLHSETDSYTVKVAY
ncbi:MAG: T9SS type A sorting domain-containing protein, partial [Bacteroidota bacterium]|nr:T9SS type A sorting domain-containing protein [Bacteroidota bacterium]